MKVSIKARQAACQSEELEIEECGYTYDGCNLILSMSGITIFVRSSELKKALKLIED